MLDVRLLREERDRLSEGLAKRGEPVDVDRLVRLDEEYRRLLAESERLKAERNTRSKEIGEMMRTGQKDGVEALKSHMRAVADRIKALDEQASAHKTRSTRCSSRFRTCRIPRCPRGPRRNQLVREWGESRSFDEPRPHWDGAQWPGDPRPREGIEDLGLGFVG